MRTIETSFSFTAVADTRQGGRLENQDTCGWGDTPYGFLITVCDGMGGGPSGKTASVTAANRIVQFVTEYADEKPDRKRLLTDAIKAANKAVFEMAQDDPLLKGMGTTVTALLINDESAIAAHVGDSRIYQFRRGRKVFRTWDHSRVFKALENGLYKNEEEARLSPDSNVILRAVGTSNDVEVDVVELPYERGDRFMLCTDGIWGAFPEKEIINMAAKTHLLSGAAESLVVRVDEAGMSNGGHHDNLTLALVETISESKLKEEMSTKHKRIMMALGVLCLVSLLVNAILLLVRPKPSEVYKKEPVDRLIDSLHVAHVDELMQIDSKYKKTIKDLINNFEDRKIREIENKLDETDELNGIIEGIKKLYPERKGERKNQMVDDLIHQFDELSASHPAWDPITVGEIKQHLRESITKQDNTTYEKNQVSGQYSAIISLLEKLKQ